MDTHDGRKRTLAEQAGLLKELGYAGAGHLWLDNLTGRLQTLDDAGLKLFQVYFRTSVAAENQPPYDTRLKNVLPLLHGRGVMLAVLITGGKPSDESADPRAVEVVRELAVLAEPHGVRLALYPHAGDWLERVEDAVRVVRKVNRPNVGVMFNLCHWLKVDEEESLRGVLDAARPHLFAVSINGADHAADIRSGRGQMIRPLDQGEFDLFGLLKTLRELGYKGPVGLQCYGLGGDARDHLERSMAAWRKLQQRLAETE
jgi:sugar phosphate isomerase/epimerase